MFESIHRPNIIPESKIPEIVEEDEEIVSDPEEEKEIISLEEDKKVLMIKQQAERKKREEYMLQGFLPSERKAEADHISVHEKTLLEIVN